MTDRFVVAEMDIDIPIKTIVHPTDCSAFSTDAFAHALRIAIAAKADLHPLHVAKAENAAEMPAFPQAQRMLAQWGLILENDEPATVTWKLGTRVTNVKIDNQRVQLGVGIRSRSPRRPAGGGLCRCRYQYSRRSTTASGRSRQP